MRRSRAEAEETRRRIVQTAAKAFRRNGIHATGLNDVMADAGLTHGGFYRHFESKGELVAEACSVGMDAIVDVARAAASGAAGREALEAILEAYLSTAHRDNVGDGCPLAGIGSELARADGETRKAASAGFLTMVDTVAKQLRRRKPADAKAEALFVLSAMIGAVTMSRIVDDPALSDAILQETRSRLAKI